VLDAIDRSRIAPERLVMIGDTPYDVSAARKARVRTIGLRSGGFTDAELEGAAAIYDAAPTSCATRQLPLWPLRRSLLT